MKPHFSSHLTVEVDLPGPGEGVVVWLLAAGPHAADEAPGARHAAAGARHRVCRLLLRGDGDGLHLGHT